MSFEWVEKDRRPHPFEKGFRLENGVEVRTLKCFEVEGIVVDSYLQLSNLSHPTLTISNQLFAQPYIMSKQHIGGLSKAQSPNLLLKMSKKTWREIFSQYWMAEEKI